MSLPATNSSHMAGFIAALLAICSAAGCGAQQADAPSEPDPGEQADQSAPGLQSNDIMEREPLANRVEVRHILISWRDLASSYGGNIDSRAKNRSSEDAEALVKSLYDRIQAGESFEALMAEHSEDRGSAQSGTPIEVSPDAPLVLDFKRLSLRLRVGESGIVRTQFGWHIIIRVS